MCESMHFLDPLPSSDVVPSVTAVASLTIDPLSDNNVSVIRASISI